MMYLMKVIRETHRTHNIKYLRATVLYNNVLEKYFIFYNYI